MKFPNTGIRLDHLMAKTSSDRNTVLQDFVDLLYGMFRIDPISPFYGKRCYGSPIHLVVQNGIQNLGLSLFRPSTPICEGLRYSPYWPTGISRYHWNPREAYEKIGNLLDKLRQFVDDGPYGAIPTELYWNVLDIVYATGR